MSNLQDDYSVNNIRLWKCAVIGLYVLSFMKF
jgi:hypothetical protein